jgi:hypothetical protein
MADSWIPVLVGLAVLGLGIALVATGWSYPVTTCFSGPAMEPSCSTNYTDSITAVALLAGGVAGIVSGSRRLWNAR